MRVGDIRRETFSNTVVCITHVFADSVCVENVVTGRTTMLNKGFIKEKN